MDGVERVLTVTNYGNESKDRDVGAFKTRVTIAPNMVQFIIASFDAVATIEGVELKKVNIIFSNDSHLELYISLMDLMTLETAVGLYFTS